MDIQEGIKIINNAANQAHARYITVGFGLILVFNEKIDEATDYIAAGYPKDLSSWPFIAAETEATGKSSKNVALDIIKIKSIWRGKAVEIEKILLKTINDFKKQNSDIELEVEAAIKQLDKI